MDNYKAVIKKVSHEQTFDATGKPVELMRVEYMVDTHGPFVEHVARQDFTAQKVQALMQATADTLRTLGGM